jgi:hypothetical protein
MEQINEIASLEILTFWVGPFLLGVEADQVTRLPRSSRPNREIHDEEAVDSLPISDLRLACGLPQASGEVERQHLLIDRGGETVAYVVDRIGDLLTVDIVKHIRPLPPLLDSQKRWPQLWGICQRADDLVLMVDLAYEPIPEG